MPNSFFDMTEEERNKVFKDVNEDVKKLTRKIAGKRNIENKTQLDNDYISDLQKQKGTLMKYKNTLNDYLTSPKYIQTGQGIFYFSNPHQLLDRLELLGGSVLAGDNGLIPQRSPKLHISSTK